LITDHSISIKAQEGTRVEAWQDHGNSWEVIVEPERLALEADIRFCLGPGPKQRQQMSMSRRLESNKPCTHTLNYREQRCWILRLSDSELKKGIHIVRTAMFRCHVRDGHVKHQMDALRQNFKPQKASDLGRLVLNSKQ
jgi:hypothetical protein